MPPDRRSSDGHPRRCHGPTPTAPTAHKPPAPSALWHRRPRARTRARRGRQKACMPEESQGPAVHPPNKRPNSGLPSRGLGCPSWASHPLGRGARECRAPLGHGWGCAGWAAKRPGRTREPHGEAQREGLHPPWVARAGMGGFHGMHWREKKFPEKDIAAGGELGTLSPPFRRLGGSLLG